MTTPFLNEENRDQLAFEWPPGPGGKLWRSGYPELQEAVYRWLTPTQRANPIHLYGLPCHSLFED